MFLNLDTFHTTKIYTTINFIYATLLIVLNSPAEGQGFLLPLFKYTGPGEQLGVYPCESAEDSGSW